MTFDRETAAIALAEVERQNKVAEQQKRLEAIHRFLQLIDELTRRKARHELKLQQLGLPKAVRDDLITEIVEQLDRRHTQLSDLLGFTPSEAQLQFLLDSFLTEEIS